MRKHLLYRFARQACGLLPVAGTLAACSGAPEPGSPEYLAYQHQAVATQVKATASDAPDWFLNPPKDQAFIYTTGSATSNDLQFAVDKAILNAKYQLADQVNGKLSGKQQDFISEAHGGQKMGTAQRTTSNVIADVALPGYQVVQRKVVPVDTQYRSFVLLQFAVARVEPPVEAAKVEPAAVEKAAEAAQRDLEQSVAAAKAPAAPSLSEPPLPSAVPRPVVEPDGTL